MADEARRILDEGVVAEPQDIDTGLIFGAGYPFFMGGITRYLDQQGISKKVNGKPFLSDKQFDAYLNR
jgi:3-hydroxyacyl-CoA dehydrogenase